MKKYLAILLTIFIFTGLFGCDSKGSVSSELTAIYTQISMDEAIVMMEEETDYIILDVRTVEEFAEKHIPNAINVPNEIIGEEDIAELPDKEQLIFVYCRSGNRSKQASEKLAALGYTNVYEFGGINEWTGETEQEMDDAVENVKNMIAALPSLEEVQVMSLEEQRSVYDAAQKAYDAYLELTEEQKDFLTQENAKVEELFSYFNTLIEPVVNP